MQVIGLVLERRGPTPRNLHSSLARWRLCCWGHLVLLLGCSGAAPAGWSWSYCSRSSSRSVQSSPQSWAEHQWHPGSIGYPNINKSAMDLTKSYIFRNKCQSAVTMMYASSDMNEVCFSTEGNSPRGQQIADRVPGTYEDFWFMAPEHCGFAGWYLHIYIHLHGLTVVIWSGAHVHVSLLAVYEHHQTEQWHRQQVQQTNKKKQMNQF